MENVIQTLALTPDSRLPSVRTLCRQFKVSAPTVVRAYEQMELRGLVYAKPKKGYFVSETVGMIRLSEGKNLLETVYINARKPGVVPLSIDAPFDQSPLRVYLNQIRDISSRRHDGIRNSSLMGELTLRAAIAELYSSFENRWHYEDVLIMPSYQNALAAVIRSRCRKSKALVESPCSWTVLRVLDLLRIEAVELDTTMRPHCLLERTQAAIDGSDIDIAIFSSRFNQVTGHALPEHVSTELAGLLEANGIHIIESAQYADVIFERIPAYHQLRGPQHVTVVGSFDKTIGPDLGVAYVLDRRPPKALFRHIQFSPNRLPNSAQSKLGELISSGKYAKGVDQLCQVMRKQRDQVCAFIDRHLPEFATSYDRPSGGTAVWVSLAPYINSEEVFKNMIKEGVAIAPGELFGLSRKYNHHMRLSYATDWALPVEHAINKLGKRLASMAQRARYLGER